MKVPNEWVEEYREEIAIEADRLHVLRSLFSPSSDTPHDNWITAITNVWIKHERANAAHKND